MLDLLFVNACIITMSDECPVIKSGYLGVSDGKIACIGEGSCTEKAAVVKNCAGNILMPGLINTHAHTAMSIMRGYADDYTLDEWLFKKVFPAEGRLDERAVAAGFRLGAAEMLRFGTTSISDMYFYQPSIAAIAEKMGIKVSLSNALVALDKGTYNPALDRSISETVELATNWHGRANGRIRADAAIHGEYTSFTEARSCMAELAQKYGLTMHVHLSETKKEHEECRTRNGKTPARVLYDEGIFDSRTIAAHCVWAEEEDHDIMREKGVSCAHNPISNMKLASGFANIKRMIDKGVNVALGTDGCCSNNSHDLFEEIKAAALIAKCINSDPTVINAYDALKLATVNGARAQGREMECGRLCIGLDADVIMLDCDKPHIQPVYDPVSAAVYAAKGNDVCLTMVQGKILYENGVFLSVDIEYAMREAKTYGMERVIG